MPAAMAPADVQIVQQGSHGPGAHARLTLGDHPVADLAAEDVRERVQVDRHHRDRHHDGLRSLAEAVGAQPGRSTALGVPDGDDPPVQPAILSGALFAFATSFDEFVTVLFPGDVEQRTAPCQRRSGVCEQSVRPSPQWPRF